MGFQFSTRSMDRMRAVNPRLVAVATLALAESAVDFGVTEEQSRTLAEQAEKVRRGVSKTMNSKHVIPAGRSYAAALDLVPFIDGQFQWGDDHWRVTDRTGRVIEPFYEIAAIMREVAIRNGVRIIWGGVWDRALNDLRPGPEGIKREVEDYKARRRAAGGSAFLDGPHFEIVS